MYINGYNGERRRYRETECGCRGESVRDINNGMEDIYKGIGIMRMGLEDIHRCEVCRGTRECEDGVCLVEEGICEITEGIADINFIELRCNIGDIRKGLHKLRKGDRCVLKGISDVRQNCTRKGEYEIAKGICEDEDGVRLLNEALRNTYFI